MTAAPTQITISGITQGHVMVDPVSKAVEITIKFEPGDVPASWWSLPSGTAIEGVLIRAPDADQLVPWPTPGDIAVKQAVLLCMEEDFQAWCWDHAGRPRGYVRSLQFARAYVCKWCGIESRGHLKTNPDALIQWHSLRTEYYRDRKSQTAWVAGPVALAMLEREQAEAMPEPEEAIA